LNTKEEILAKLRANEPFRKIRTEVSSISKLYEVAGQYLDEIDKDLRDKRLDISKLKEEETNLETEVGTLRSDIESLSEEKRQLEQDKTRLSGELSENKVKLETLQEKMGEFRVQGFTLEIIKKLEPMVERGATMLLKQVENVENYNEAVKDFAGVKRSKACLLREVRVLARKKEKTQDSLVSLKNQIDDMRLRARHIKEAVDTVVWLLKKGYDIKDIKSLGYGLDFLGVEGDPDLTISRLITGLRQRKNLVILEEEVTKKRHEKDELDKAIEKKRTTLEIIGDTTLKSVNEICSASIQSIQQTTAERQKALNAVCQKFDDHVLVSMANLQVNTKDRLEWVEEQVHRESEIAQQKILFETELKYGRFYQAFFVSDDFLSEISLPWILHVSRRLHLWISMNLPKETIIPPSSFNGQFGLICWPYNLTTLADQCAWA
jgi:hypothetical protein